MAIERYFYRRRFKLTEAEMDAESESESTYMRAVENALAEKEKAEANKGK